MTADELIENLEAHPEASCGLAMAYLFEAIPQEPVPPELREMLDIVSGLIAQIREERGRIPTVT